MLAAVVHGAGDLRIEERQVPAPSDGEVTVRITHGGICGSDLSYYRKGAVGAFTITEPLVLGHEVVGRVHRDPAREWAEGTPVAIHPGSHCGRCPECLTGQTQVCRNATYLGSAASSPHTQGGFVELVNLRAGQLRRLPDGLPLSRAVLAEPLGVAIHAVGLAGDLRGARVLVNGSGPIGSLVVGAARAAGATEIWATDLVDNPLRIAAEVGADTTVRIGSEPLPERYFDVAFESSGAPPAVGPTLQALRGRGVMVQVGMLPAGPVSTELALLASREIEVRGSFRFRDEIDDAVRLLADEPRLGAVVTHTFGLRDAEHALRTAADASASGKVVLRISE